MLWGRKSTFRADQRFRLQTGGPGDALKESYVRTLWPPQRAEGVKSQHVSVDDREDFSVHNLGVVSNTWGTQKPA